MIKINILAVGRVKTPEFTNKIIDYQTRLKATINIEITEVPEELDSNPNALLIEGQNLLKRIQSKDLVIVLDKDGMALSSNEFATYLNNQITKGTSTIVFVIGSSIGLSEDIKKRANFTWSFSKLTFTHELARLLLLEQIYRFQQIQLGTKYHK